MEREKLVITWKRQLNNAAIKQQTQLPDVLPAIKSSKWNWAEQVIRATDNWPNDLTSWKPIGKRNRSRCRTRRWNEIAHCSVDREGLTAKRTE